MFKSQQSGDRTQALVVGKQILQIASTTPPNDEGWGVGAREGGRRTIKVNLNEVT